MDSRLEITPRASRSSSASSRKSAGLTLDLSSLPPISTPTPPSNTLLFTNLNNSETFTPESLSSIRERIAAIGKIHAFAPLKSFRRIIISFFDEHSAVAVRQDWDGENVNGERLKVYFGNHTPLEIKDESLQLPDAGKLFFISPPPSPPHGWEVKLEDAPNKLVHAADLAVALAKLHHHEEPVVAVQASPVSPVGGFPGRTRTRSSTLIYQPDAESPNPAVVVDDMTDEPEDISPSPVDTTKPIMAHTSRPPVELMNE